MTRVLFRVDASVSIGTGHMMRCLTLAEALTAKGASVTFLIADLPGNLNARVSERGFDLVSIPEAEAASPQATRHEVSLQRLQERIMEPFDWLIVDHYSLDARWESAMRVMARKILAIDDLADRPHDCDVLLDQNYFRTSADRYAGLLPPHCTRLIGPRYALLRPGFQRGKAVSFPEKPRLLICFGGSDPNGETMKALAAIRILNRPDVAVDVVVGSSNPGREAIEALCRELPAEFHCQTEDMPRLMHEATLSVGSGGTITWERLCAGLPALVVTIAGNQEDITRNLAEDGYILYAGPSKTVSAESLARQIAALLEQPTWLGFMSRRGQALVDGLGAARVARLLCQPEITLRPAAMADCDTLLAWRNDEMNRRFSLDSTLISPEAHRAWFTDTLSRPARLLLIGESNDGAVGVLRYDLSRDANAVATVSVYLVPGRHGQGLGSALLEAGSRWLETHAPQVRHIDATILEENAASQSAFLKAGYVGYSRIFRKRTAVGAHFFIKS